MCLPVEKVNDNNVNCLGATDEPTLCGKNRYETNWITFGDFYCMNPSSRSCISDKNLCDGYNDCEHEDNEQFCSTNQTSSIDGGICGGINIEEGFDIEMFLCNYHIPTKVWKVIYFRLDRMTYSVENRAKNMKNTVSSSSSTIKISDLHSPRCHRGLDSRVWLNNKNGSTTYTCLCPPSYYGDICQYQN
jgi:hypothetical protein